MWYDEKPVRVQRSLMEMFIEDMEYESRRFEAKAEQAFDDISDTFVDGILDIIFAPFGGSSQRR